MGQLTQSAAWQNLLRHKEKLQTRVLADLITDDPQRLSAFEIGLSGLRLNYALQFVVPETLTLLAELARQQDLEVWRAKMFSGAVINNTENRAVLHTALRDKNDHPLKVAGHDVRREIIEAKARMEKTVAAVRSGAWKGATGKRIRHVVNIGIGGSDLGPRMVVRALETDAAVLRVHFVANADAYDLFSTLENLDPAETLFVVVSKTFTTQETLLNAQSAEVWLTERLGKAAAAQHFIAVSTAGDKATKFGIAPENIFPLWDWVGGRTSLWSAAGFGIALAVGMEDFTALCDGAAAMDLHFLEAPFEKNMPVVLALLEVWQRNFLDAQTQAILPYSERLRDLPRYLQQLDMESNGKSVTRDGRKTDYATGPVIFGECGTVAQHSFHQWLHQGSEKVPADFIGVVHDDLRHPEHHRALMSNMVAQACALAFGQSQAERPQNVYPGGRSSNLILLDKLDPPHLGMLIALYEHKIFTQGVIWNINSFDQPGVELGKKMAKQLASGAGPDNPAAETLALLYAKIAPL